MATLTEWVRQLVVLVFVVSAAHLLLPTGKMRPYVRFVLGLVIVSALLATLFDFTDLHFDLDTGFVPGADSGEAARIVQRGEAVAAAGVAGWDAYRLEVAGEGVRKLAPVVLGAPAEGIRVEAGPGGRFVVRIAGPREGDVEPETAARLLERMLGLEIGRVKVLGDDGRDDDR